MADQLVTLTQIKNRLQQAGGSGPTYTATDDTVLGELNDQVSDWIQHYTGRKFIAETAATYTFDTEAGYVLRVPRGVRTITTLGVATTHQPDSGGSYTTVAAHDYLLRPIGEARPEGWPYTEVRISRGTLNGTIRQFSAAENGATITGNFGFATVPPDVQSVTVDAIVSAYVNRKNGASSQLGADGDALPPWVSFFSKGSPQRGTLDRYRYWGLG